MNEKKNLSPPSPLNGRKINEETEPNFESLKFTDSWLKFGMWGAEGGGYLYYKNNLSSTREHGAIRSYMRENRVLVLNSC